jgi:hypothetical protein
MMNQPRRLALPLLILTVVVGVAGCSADSSPAGTKRPGQVAASQPPFDAKSFTARYVDRCMKDGGTIGRCQCEAADLTSRLGEDGLARVVKGLEAGGSDALAAIQEQRPSLTACGWPNTKL